MMDWWGVAIIGSIAVATAYRAVTAIQARRFGLKHIKITDLLGLVLMISMGTLFFYGWFRYPDAPLHPCDGPTGYCGKQGQPHSLSEFRAFGVWQTALLIVWPAGLLSAFALRRIKLAADGRPRAATDPANPSSN